MISVITFLSLLSSFPGVVAQDELDGAQVVGVTVSTPTAQPATAGGEPVGASENTNPLNVVIKEMPIPPIASAEAIATEDAQMISYVISNMTAFDGNTAETLIDRPERRNSFLQSDLAVGNSTPFTPLTSAYFACLASLTQVLCLPAGTYNFGTYSLNKIASFQFALNQVRYLVGPLGFSIKIVGSGVPGQNPENVIFNTNITSGDALATTFASRLNTRNNVISDQMAHIEVSVPFDVPCVCGYEDTDYAFDSNCFGPGGPSQMAGISINSLAFQGGAALNGVWQFANGTLQTFSTSSNQPNLPRFLGLLGLDELTGQIYSIAVVATGV